MLWSVSPFPTMPTAPASKERWLRKCACLELDGVFHRVVIGRKANGYPLIDHDTMYKVKTSKLHCNPASFRFLVSHAYWNPRSEAQLVELQASIDKSDLKFGIVTRDAKWGGENIKQVFVFGHHVPVPAVLALPYDHFDSRCSAPSSL